MPDRALKTIPKEVIIKPSTIPGAGQGAFAASFLAPFIWIEFAGAIKTAFRKHSEYAWLVKKQYIFIGFVYTNLMYCFPSLNKTGALADIV